MFDLLFVHNDMSWFDVTKRLKHTAQTRKSLVS